MNEILEILGKNARLSNQEIADQLGLTAAEVATTVQGLEKSGIIVGYRAYVNQEKLGQSKRPVRALIEVSVTPQRDVGFDAIAERIYQFEEVIECQLVSGTYDLLVVVEGSDIHTVSGFVASRLSPLEGVTGTVTHFLLKSYKVNGVILDSSPDDKRLKVTP